MKKRLYIIAIAAAVLRVLAGCVEEIDHVTYPDEHISFTVGLAPHQTRSTYGMSGLLGFEEADRNVSLTAKGAPTVALEGDAGIIAYLADNADPWDKMTNRKFSFEGNMLTSDNPVRWSEVTEDQMKIYAYAPYIDATQLDPSALAGLSFATSPAIPYVIDSDVSKQIDIIEAEAVADVSAAKGTSVPLEFRHVLTAVRFKLGFGSGITVKSLEVKGVHGTGIFRIGEGWTVPQGSSHEALYRIDFEEGKTFSSGDMLTDGGLTMLLMPQELPEGASAVMVYSDSEGEKTITASLAGKTWESGKMITYIFYDSAQDAPVYFDLAAGDISINGTSYKGWVYVNGEKTEVSGTHSDANQYYVYQSTGDASGDHDKNSTGWVSQIGVGECRIPDYDAVTWNGRPWSDFIKNNSSVADVITAWDNKDGNSGAAVSAGRNYTNNRIHVQGSGMTVNLTIDDIYSRYTELSVGRTKAGIAFNAEGNASLVLKLIGDNRVGAVHYHGPDSNNQLVFEGSCSITVASADHNTDITYNKTYAGETSANDTTFYSNHWCSAIGGNDSSQGNSHGIVINSGDIFVGTTKAENCTALGAGGNDHATISIHGGNVTAVASTTGTAIGGGIGFNATGGTGTVTITGGNVYAYNHSNRWDIPSSAIGGAGSSSGEGNIGTVTVSGGNVYAQSAVGTAIGGGSSKTRKGGKAVVRITGGTVVARSVSAESGETSGKILDPGAGIGGGSGCTGGGQGSTSIDVNGGDAEINISGNAVIMTGSIGGGKSGHSNGKIGTAAINVSGGYIQGQFVMAAGALTAPSFEMTGGIIRNSNTADGADEYFNIVKDGGAVYMEDGTFNMSDGSIMECSAENGGAVYIRKGEKTEESPQFTMSGGTIQNCSADGDGGAVYLEDGSVTITGGSILHNTGRGYGGAVCIRKTSDESPSFSMSDGELIKNISARGGGAVYLEGGEVTVSGGEISGNITEEGNGGGICINSGTFSMPSDGTASIHGNAALMSDGEGGYGGGVFVTSVSSAVTVDILSGSIEGNSSSLYGGGICVDMAEHDSVEATVTVGSSEKSELTNPDISGNVTLHKGGGLYVNGSKANVIVNSGKVLDNKTVAYVDNPDIVNTTGMVTLNGGDVESVTVTFDGNGGLSGGNAVLSQKIVTATNNRLNLPTGFTRSGYVLKRWNTRADGLGTKDYTDGETVNLNTDLTLYAIWE